MKQSSPKVDFLRQVSAAWASSIENSMRSRGRCFGCQTRSSQRRVGMLDGEVPRAAGICRIAVWISRNSRAEWMSCWAARSVDVPVVPGLVRSRECQ